MIIRSATLSDAEAMEALRSASIRALCGPDHHNDPLTIDSWIGPSGKFERLLGQQHATLIVAEIDASIVGLGSLSGDMITLNYVHPDHRFRGVSKAILTALEARLAGNGIGVGRLYSTMTALRFYQAMGWVEAGPETRDQGQPMTKRISRS